MLQLLKTDRRLVNIDRIAKEIYSNVQRVSELGGNLIEYSWYNAGATQISPLKTGIDCRVLRMMSAEFCVENTQAIMDVVQQMLPNSLIGLDIHDICRDDGDVVKPADFHTRTRATNELAADVRALEGTGGLLEQMAHLQYNRRQAQAEIYEAVLAKGPYSYIVVDWSEDESDDES